MLALLLATAIGLAETPVEPPRHDPVDVGLGIDVGLTTGLKLRALATPPSGLVLGMDFDVGTILFISEATASVVAGWSFEQEKHVLRPYATAGVGAADVFSLTGGGSGTIVRLGAGAEWKPGRAFGLGADGGLLALGAEKLPYARLSGTFYAF